MWQNYYFNFFNFKFLQMLVVPKGDYISTKK